jgi:hypothetical protein
MAITIKSDPATRAWNDAQDAMLIRMQTPLARFDQYGHPMLDGRGRVMLRQASTDALSLAGAPLYDIFAAYLRHVGSPKLRRFLSKAARVQVVTLATNRGELQRFFPRVSPRGAGGVMLSHTTGDLPGLLADTLGKATSTAYAESRRTWRAWARRGVVDNFEQQDRVRLDDFDNLPVKLPADSITFDKITEVGREQFTLATYARGVKLTRVCMLNDDISLLASIPTGFVAAASRLEDALAYGVLETNAAMADTVALFATAHVNTMTGALTATTYGTARAKLARQTSPGGSVVDLVGARLIVPPELSGTAENVLADSARAQRALDESPALLVESPFLANTAQWYLAADPAKQPPVEVAFLRDEPEPQVFEATDFDSDGIKIKVRHHVAAAAIDHRPIVRSNGA